MRSPPTRAIVWRRLDAPGHDACRLSETRTGLRLEGTAAFLDRRTSCRLDYAVACDVKGRTRSATVEGWWGDAAIGMHVSSDRAGRWRLNGQRAPQVDGCLDIDLEFSPSTNLVHIRRLGLQVGESAALRAAWLRFPGRTLEPLDQRYTRAAPDVYRYESGGFAADLEVDREGFVTDYPPFWRAEAGD